MSNIKVQKRLNDSRKEVKDLKAQIEHLKIQIEDKNKVIDGKRKMPSLLHLVKRITETEYSDKELINKLLHTLNYPQIDMIQTSIDPSNPRKSLIVDASMSQEFFICLATLENKDEYEIVQDGENYKWVKRVFKSGINDIGGI
jgi:hypothetical protein